MRSSKLYLNETFFRQLIDRLLMAHDDFAEELGVSRSHWSTILNGHQALSKRMRKKLLASPHLRGVPAEQLWRELEPEASCAA